ncbi:MAG: hypothetical protein H0X11_04285, partial [Betaproteobacteria bacterium]|nr:hypothetical protein [Betaproteobacteria bacterium]
MFARPDASLRCASLSSRIDQASLVRPIVRFAALLGLVSWLFATSVVTAAPDRPIADAGRDRSVAVGMPVAIDGSNSRDPGGRLITFHWTIAQAPVGSAAELDPVSPAPLLVPDVPGSYVLQLVVATADNVQSLPTHMTLTAVEGVAAPVAMAGRDRSAAAGLPIEIDGQR